MYQVGIIGCGGIASDHHGGFAGSGRAEVAWVWDTDAEAVAKRAEEWGARAAESADALIEKADIVVIASPGFAHREYVEKAAAAKKAILCEKPIALSLEDALAMRAAVEAAGVPFMCAFTGRHSPDMLKMKNVLDSGEIGGVVSAWAYLAAPASSARWLEIEKTGHWRSSMELSGGRINEFCSHTINWLLWILGKPRTVYGKALHVTLGFSLDDADAGVVECEHGVGVLYVNRHAGVAKHSDYAVMGHGGSVTARNGKLQLKRMDEEPVDIEPESDVPSKQAHFLDCLESGEPTITGIDDAIDTLRVCLAFNRSAESGKVEDC